MSLHRNPLRLNPLQLKTLTLLQELARFEAGGHPPGDDGEMPVSDIPHPHGDHFHIGRKVVAAADATGLTNPSVWAALKRKGLVRVTFPGSAILTRAGVEYDTGLAERILHDANH